MWKYRILQYAAAFVIILGSFSCVRSGDIETVVKLSPIQLSQDIDFLFLQLESVHPNVCVHISEKRYAKIQNHLRRQCGGPLTLQEFYKKVKMATDHLEEGHTFVHAPLGKTPSEQKKATQAQLDTLLVTKGVHQNSYELLPDPEACLLRYNSCGLPRERPEYEALFAEMFAEMRNNNIRDLIIDVRKNGGGFSGTNDLLIRYFARAAFRQYEKMEKRLTPQATAFYNSVGIDYMSYLHEAYDTSSLTLDPNGVPTQRDFTVEAKLTDPVEGPFRFAGRVYVLIGRGTYSSAMLFAATVQHYGLATLIGEETLRFCQGRQHYGDVVVISLPHSQLTIQISTAIFTAMVADKKEATRIVPDYEVAQKRRDTNNKIDTVEMFALNMLAKRSPE